MTKSSLGSGFHLFWLKKNPDFSWSWFTAALDLGSWAHVCQLLRARLESCVGSALAPKVEAGGGERVAAGRAQPTPGPPPPPSLPRSDCRRAVFCFGDTKGSVIIFTSDDVTNGLFNPQVLPRTSKWGSGDVGKGGRWSCLGCSSLSHPLLQSPGEGTCSAQSCWWETGGQVTAGYGRGLGRGAVSLKVGGCACESV